MILLEEKIFTNESANVSKAAKTILVQERLYYYVSVWYHCISRETVATHQCLCTVNRAITTVQYGRILHALLIQKYCIGKI